MDKVIETNMNIVIQFNAFAYFSLNELICEECLCEKIDLKLSFSNEKLDEK